MSVIISYLSWRQAATSPWKQILNCHYPQLSNCLRYGIKSCETDVTCSRHCHRLYVVSLAVMPRSITSGTICHAAPRSVSSAKLSLVRPGDRQGSPAVMSDTRRSARGRTTSGHSSPGFRSPWRSSGRDRTLIK
jgi:hypothetical protein